jgi:hypothetical protein
MELTAGSQIFISAALNAHYVRVYIATNSNYWIRFCAETTADAHIKLI